MKRIKGGEGDSDDSSTSSPPEACKKIRTTEETAVSCGSADGDWARLPQELLLHIFQYLPLLDRAYASQVCRKWNQAFHMPELWRCFEFELNQPASSYLKATHPDLIKQIIKRHSNHLQYVSFKVRLCLLSNTPASFVFSSQLVRPSAFRYLPQLVICLLSFAGGQQHRVCRGSL